MFGRSNRYCVGTPAERALQPKKNGLTYALVGAVFVLPMAAALVGLPPMAAPPVRAQVAPVQTAVVLDFEVAPGLDSLLGRKAADSVAVELKSSGDFDVVSRQRLEEIVATVPGLRPPYTPATARRLGEAVGANTVITGRIVAATLAQERATQARTTDTGTITGTPVEPGVPIRTARVQIEMRQMDVRTGDFINGAQPVEITTDAYNELDDDVLIDQSLDKVAYSGVRQIRLYVPTEATILNTTATDVELNKGYRDGVRNGQRYSVMRDRYNVSRRIVERVKVAEIRISRVDANSATAVVVDGGAVGVRTNDKARRIFGEGIPFTEPRTNFGASRATGSSR